MVLLSRILHLFVLHKALVSEGGILGFALLLAGLLFFGDALLGAIGRARTLLLLILPILAMPCLLAAAIFSLLFASSINRLFVATHGAPGTAVITAIIPAETTSGHPHDLQYRTLIRRTGSPTLTSTLFESDPAAFYPQPKPEDLTLPSVNTPFAILAIPGDESNFVILTNDPTINPTLPAASLSKPILTPAPNPPTVPPPSPPITLEQEHSVIPHVLPASYTIPHDPRRPSRPPRSRPRSTPSRSHRNRPKRPL